MTKKLRGIVDSTFRYNMQQIATSYNSSLRSTLGSSAYLQGQEIFVVPQHNAYNIKTKIGERGTKSDLTTAQDLISKESAHVAPTISGIVSVTEVITEAKTMVDKFRKGFSKASSQSRKAQSSRVKTRTQSSSKGVSLG